MDPTPPIPETRAVRCGCADALSDVLDAVRLRSNVASLNEFTAPWGVRVPGPKEGPSEPPGQREIPTAGFYAIIDGGCWLEINGHPPLCLSGGDVVDLQEIESLLRELLSLRAAPQARRTAETQAK